MHCNMIQHTMLVGEHFKGLDREASGKMFSNDLQSKYLLSSEILFIVVFCGDT